MELHERLVSIKSLATHALNVRPVKRGRKESACKINHADGFDRCADSSLETSCALKPAPTATSPLDQCSDTLSGAIAKRAGFKGTWALELSIASSQRPSRRLRMIIVECIVESTELPVLVYDGGFGNVNNARLLARKLGQGGTAEFAPENGCFPRINSFVGGAPTKCYRIPISAYRDASILHSDLGQPLHASCDSRACSSSAAATSLKAFPGTEARIATLDEVFAFVKDHTKNSPVSKRVISTPLSYDNRRQCTHNVFVLHRDLSCTVFPCRHAQVQFHDALFGRHKNQPGAGFVFRRPGPMRPSFSSCGS